MFDVSLVAVTDLTIVYVILRNFAKFQSKGLGKSNFINDMAVLTKAIKTKVNNK